MSLLGPDTVWRIHERAESALLIDGADYYRAFYEAAVRAEKSICLLGWQFDSDVELLRGDDLRRSQLAPQDVELLALLDRLCREREDLTVRVLAWDHSVVFALERQILQKLHFDMLTTERFEFRWDNTVPLGGSHHQKVAIVDGQVAFFGSQDICQARWDDSTHRADNPERLSRGAVHQPYHEVQVAVRGDAARSLVELFVARWEGATGERLDPESLVGAPEVAQSLPVTLPMPPARIGLARTIPEIEGRACVREVCELYARVIAAAERFVYIESQYLTSASVRDALGARMADRGRSALEIVVVLPYKPEKLKEEVTIGLPQALALATIKDAAHEYGHALGIYNVLAGERPDGSPLHVYIHSKLMIVDDRWFIVGSANLTNRSMLIDSEICAVYEADGDPELHSAIRRARVRLLLEHAGPDVRVRDLVSPKGLVARLDALVESGRVRLAPYALPEEKPSALAQTVHELALEFLDPTDIADYGGPQAGSNT